MTTTSKKTHTSSQIENALRQNDHPLIENSTEIIALLDAEGTVTYVSPSITSLLGYTPEEIVGCPALVLVHPDDLDTMQQMLGEIGQSPGKSLRAEYRFGCKDGSWLWFEGSGTNLLHVPGIGAIVANFRDITKRKLVPRSHWSEMSESEHFVQFYETDVFLLDSLSEFIATGLGAGDACIVIARKALRESLEERLKANGLDLAAADTRGEYISLDAIETLPKFMVDGLPDPERFAQVIGSVIARAAKSQQRVRIFGEMVALLWADGKQAAAIRLEELWNDLHNKTYPFSLFCAYPMHGFDGEVYGVQFAEICKRHSRVIPDESYSALAGPDERLHAITLLQQKANSLEAEIAERKVVEERLRISENRYRRLFEMSRDGILIVDPRTYTITDANPYMTELLGYTHEQLLGQELWQIGLFKDREANLEVFGELQEKRFLRYETLPLYTGDGQYRYVEFVSILYQANSHQVIQCNMRDITERKQAEEERQRFVALVENSTDFIGIADANQQAFFVNRAGQQLVGLSGEEEVQRTNLLDYFPPEEQQRVKQEILPLLLQNGHWDGEVFFQHFQTGERISMLWNVFVLRDKKTGRIQNYACVSRDIREHKQREEEHYRLAAIVESTDDAIIGKTLDGMITSWNKAAERMYGYSAQEVIGKHITTIFPQDKLGEFEEFVRLLTRGEQIGHYETQRVRKDGHRLDVSITISPMKNEHGTVIGASTIARDITERMLMERRKDEFITIASHELKTPVTSLKGFTQVLQRRFKKQADEESLRFLTIMNTQVDKLTRLINELLDVSKIQQGKLDYREDPFDLDALVQEIVENLQAGISTHQLLIEDRTELQVYGDRDRIGQVLINLLTNAIKYSPKADTVIVRVSKDQENAIVSVQDFGIGIAATHYEQIFERFYQVTDPEEKTYSGLGMGLYISNEIIKRHHGRMQVESKKGVGSTFSFTLPLREGKESSFH